MIGFDPMIGFDLHAKLKVTTTFPKTKFSAPISPTKSLDFT